MLHDNEQIISLGTSAAQGDSIWKDIHEFRYQIIRLAWLESIRQYRGAMLGWAWMILKPLIQLFAFWFVFKVGLRVRISKEGIDLFPWLAVGWMTWLYISDAISGGTTALRSYKYLITKMRFPVSVIPVIRAIANLNIHLILMALLLIFLLVDGSFSIHWVQLPLYVGLMVLFAVFWGMLAAPLGAISNDFTQLVKSVMRLLFWLSGVFYNINTIDIAWMRTIMRFNPITFFIEGYRNTLLYHRWFWEDREAWEAFILVFGLLIILALITFKRTRKEVVDVI